MNNYKVFETDRLHLKPTTEEDAKFIFDLLNSPKWLKNIGDRNIHTLLDAQEYIKTKMLPQLKQLGFSNYTIIRKEDKVKIGSCGLYNRDGLEGIDIGFAFLPEYEKKGYAYEAANKLKEAAFKIFDLKKISAITSKNNIESQNLLLKLGLKLVETITLPNDTEELLLFKIDKE
ncbi:GNAT family N-acetyltransferase [Cellulophaga sp. 20_2_10]|uniref:GNAT family N-acetyltransferase n=1 Tax=Cellulophaga sp. 20_2_10 TaxID=2942476 RepID=UPI00201B1047|nr:GNAT family N-acetyltransferase [Cellulophaga sp. 20_2_10]MCL5246935.1 GNAT family N-acetyltransferase [Cellulophaga sp. 20_2_10]